MKIISVTSLILLMLMFQNCSNKGQLDLDSKPPEEPKMVDSINAPVFIRAADPKGAALLGYNDIVDDPAQGRVFRAKAGEAYIIESPYKIKIDINKKYKLSGKFRSVGPELSRLYFGLAPYKKNGSMIQVFEAYRTGSMANVSNVYGNTIEVSTDLIGWNNPPAYGYSRCIGFYYDGVTARLPDFVLYDFSTSEKIYGTAASNGAYSSATGRQVQLNIPIPEQEILKINNNTKIMNHSSGGTYIYTAAQYNDTPLTWHTFSGTIKGFDMNNSVNKFRPETDTVAIMLLPNYSQTGSQQILFDEIRFEEVE